MRTVRRCVRTFVLYERTRRPPRIKLSGEFRELRHVRERARLLARARTHESRYREESPTWVRAIVEPYEAEGSGRAAGRARFRDSLEDISHFRAAPEAWPPPLPANSCTPLRMWTAHPAEDYVGRFPFLLPLSRPCSRVPRFPITGGSPGKVSVPGLECESWSCKVFALVCKIRYRSVTRSTVTPEAISCSLEEVSRAESFETCSNYFKLCKMLAGIAPSHKFTVTWQIIISVEITTPFVMHIYSFF